MCTVTFIARRSGYALGMNRDEKLSRVTALPPARYRFGNRQSLFPSEPSGGTWIGVNDAAVTFALLNWYSIPARAPSPGASRGLVVTTALAADSPLLAADLLADLPLPRINPFRLIAIFPAEKEILEWRWNLKFLDLLAHPWLTKTWISSGFDEPGAQKTRSHTFHSALQQSSAGSLDWLRRLHRSHLPTRSPYSTCMHRSDAATVSYTETIVTRDQISLRYHPGAPCEKIPSTIHFLKPQLTP